MSTLYIINNTVGDGVITISPGALNGPGGTLAGSDLRLYGQGTTQYGEGTNENLYKITESFACPEKILNDFKPGTDDPNGFVPGTGTYDPSVDPVLPQDKYDLGVNNGINNPLKGQPWFNTSRNKLMTYVDGTAGFQFAGAPSTGATPPASPVEGDMWYDTSIPQLKVYDDGTFGWLSSADRYVQHDGTIAMTGDLDLGTTNKIINVAEPTLAQDATTMNYVDTEIARILSPNYELDVRYLELAGDTMAGNITMGTNQVIFGAMTLNSGNGVISAGPDISINANGLIAADNTLYLNIDSDNSTVGNLIVSKGDSVIGGAETELFRIDNTGTITVPTGYESLVTTDRVVPNKKYVDSEIASVAGTASTAAQIWPSKVLSGAKAGDIAIQAGEIFIATIVPTVDSDWKQIFPAVYA